jgi:hypothetical protein
MASEADSNPVDIPATNVDVGSDGVVELRVNETLAGLGLRYLAVDSGTLLLQEVSSESDDYTDGELSNELGTRLDRESLRTRLGVNAFRIESRH